MSRITIKNGHVITMDGDRREMAGTDISLEDGLITAIGKNLPSDGGEVLDAAGAIIMPGLVDGHRHVWQSLLRGVAGDWSFQQYMTEARTMYCGCFDAEDAYIANLLGGLESLNAGITTIVDHSHLQSTPEVSDALARGLKDSGIGGAFCYALQNVPFYADGETCDPASVKVALTRPPDEWHDENAARVRDTHFRDGNLKFGVALPEMTPYVPADFAGVLVDRAQALQPTLVTGHWNAISQPGYYQSSLGALLQGGHFKAPTLFSHNNDMSDDDLKLMVSHQMGLCSCPEVEHGMGIGECLARRFVELGGAASLGLDVTCFVQADLFKQARILLLAERKRLADAVPGFSKGVGYTTRQVLELLTITGARSLGMDDRVGSLEVGKQADVVVLAANPIFRSEIADPAEIALFHTDAADVSTVIVEGTFRKRDGKLVGLDERDISRRAAASREKITRRYQALPKTELADVWAETFS